MTETRKPPRTLVGLVTGHKMQKTLVVRVDRTVEHPRYHKPVRNPLFLKAHDEKDEARVGAHVRVAATRPLSRTKRWRLIQIIQQGPET